MAISVVGSAVAAGNTLTLPSHEPGDVVVAFAYDATSSTAPDADTSLFTPPLFGSDTVSGGSNSCFYAVFTSSGDSDVVAFTTATLVAAVILRGDTEGAAITYRAVGGTASSGTSINFPATDPGTSSLFVAFAGHATADSSLETPPTNMVNVTNIVGAASEASIHITTTPATSWPSTNVSVGGTSANYVSVVISVEERSQVGNGFASMQSLPISSYTFSNSDRTIELPSSAFAVSSAYVTDGKRYVEFTVGNIYSILALYDASSANKSVFYLPYSGQVQVDGVVAATFEAATDGDTLSFAFDLGTEQFWVKRNAGYWNNDDLADPSIGVGGLSINGGSGIWCVAFIYLFSGTMTATLSTDEGNFTYSMPLGFSPFVPEPPPPAVPVKVWDGSSWVTGVTKVWDGSAWVAKTVHVF